MKHLISVFLLCTSIVISSIVHASCTQDHVGPCNDTIDSADSSDGDRIIPLVLVSVLVYLLISKFGSKADFSADLNATELVPLSNSHDVIRFH